jgi:hypothetical protein
MAGEMNNVLEATLNILQGNQQEWSFSDLARCVIRQAHVDEASAKAAILRLSSEGHLEITPHWLVRLPQRALGVVAA